MLLVVSRWSGHFLKTATQQPYLVQVPGLCDRQKVGQAWCAGSLGWAVLDPAGPQLEARGATKRYRLGSARLRTNRFSPAAGSLAPRPSPRPAPFLCPLLE